MSASGGASGGVSGGVCGNCSQPTRGDRALCPECVTRVDDYLVRLYRRTKGPNVLDELSVTVTRQARLSDPRGGRGGAETPLVYHGLASARFGALQSYLRQSARVHRVHLRPDALSRVAARVDTPWMYAMWLHRYWPQMSRRPDSAEFAATLQRLVDDAIAVIDRPADEWYAGRCPTCNADLYATENGSMVRCKGCRASIDVAAQRERLLAAVDDVLATATEISRAVHITGSEVTPSKITNLYHRGKLLRHGRNRTGDHLYRMGDVLNVLRAQHASQQANRS